MTAGAFINYDLLSNSTNNYLPIAASFKITTLDTAAKKISGEFSGTVVEAIAGDTIVISNGTFTNLIYKVN